jgi:hypothetical protein
MAISRERLNKMCGRDARVETPAAARTGEQMR